MGTNASFVDPDGRVNTASLNVERMQDVEHYMGPRVSARRLVPITQLRLGAAYQRQSSGAKIKQMVRTFFWPAFGSLTVSQREGGDYFVIDGAHRAIAAALRGIAKVPCEVFTGLTPDQEARAFVMANKHRKAPTGVEVFRAQVQAQDERAREVKALLDEAGLKAGGSNSRTTISAIQTLHTMIKQGLDVRSVLAFIPKAWPVDHTIWRTNVLKSVGALEAKLKKQLRLDLYDPDVLAKFQAVSLVALRQRALAIWEMQRCARSTALLRAMIDHWNQGRQTRFLAM